MYIRIRTGNVCYYGTFHDVLEFCSLEIGVERESRLNIQRIHPIYMYVNYTHAAFLKPIEWYFKISTIFENKLWVNENKLYIINCFIVDVSDCGIHTDYQY